MVDIDFLSELTDAVVITMPAGISFFTIGRPRSLPENRPKEYYTRGWMRPSRKLPRIYPGS